MRYLTLDNETIPYIIERKNNKNTYFHFKKEGYIKINLSKHQKEKDAIKFIQDNKDKFLSKLKALQSKKTNSDYYLKGHKYQLVQNDTFKLDQNNHLLYTNNSDQHKQLLMNIEKGLMMELLNSLYYKNQNNNLINIKDIKLKTRYTKTRHGSCNAKKRTINMNLNLIHYDVIYIEYVFLHEITHLNIQNHQKEFYDLFVKLCPNYQQIRKQLKEIYR